MSRHRGAKLLRRYGLLGGISLLSPEYLLSVERWPFHSEPPDHYDLLSYLLDLSVSQLSGLLPLHSWCDFRPHRAHLRTPPLLFGRRPPQSNYPPDTVCNPDYGSTLEHQNKQGGISRSAPQKPESLLQSLPPILCNLFQCSVSSCSEGSRGLSVLPRVHCIFTAISTSLSLG